MKLMRVEFFEQSELQLLQSLKLLLMRWISTMSERTGFECMSEMLINAVTVESN